MWFNKNVFLLLIVLLLLSGCNTSAFMRGNALKDEDWNTSFESNCPLPHYDSIRWASEENRRYMRFALSDGDKGGCVNDKTARHGAPYWERAELRQVATLKKNSSYTIDTTLRFVEGFDGQRESFFQIHAYNKACKQAYPPIMIKFNKGQSNSAVLTLDALTKNKRHNSYRSDLRIDDVLGKWLDMKINLETTENGSISVSINGEIVFSDVPFWIEACGIPRIKIGAYRPGSSYGNVKSVVDYDSIQVY